MFTLPYCIMSALLLNLITSLHIIIVRYHHKVSNTTREQNLFLFNPKKQTSTDPCDDNDTVSTYNPPPLRLVVGLHHESRACEDPLRGWVHGLQCC